MEKILILVLFFMFSCGMPSEVKRPKPEIKQTSYADQRFTKEMKENVLKLPEEGFARIIEKKKINDLFVIVDSAHEERQNARYGIIDLNLAAIIYKHGGKSYVETVVIDWNQKKEFDKLYKNLLIYYRAEGQIVHLRDGKEIWRVIKIELPVEMRE